jgi:hypothetical protein
MDNYNRYQKFRAEVYLMLGKGKDSTFELMDSIMTTRNAYCLADFSLSPFFRRKWHSVYEAIQDNCPNANKLMKRYLEEIPELDYVLLAIDHTPWAMPDAPTMKDRGHQHSAKAQNASVLGQGYSTIAWLPPTGDSWTLPLRHERITSFESPGSKAIWQLKQVTRRIKSPTLVVLDCEYGNGKFVHQTATIEASLLMRIRSNCCLSGQPPTYCGKGRPKKADARILRSPQNTNAHQAHGHKFKINDPQTHLPPQQQIEIEDPKLGLIRVSQWQNLHFYNAPSRPLSLIKVERLNLKKTGSCHRPLWLVWVGEQFLPLEFVWSQYAIRFGVDHWYRLAKQRLHWNTPSFGTPQQCQKWSHLIPLMTWQLWLAKPLVEDHRLPWQKPQSNLTPERVAQSLFSLLPIIGTPAVVPKTRGKSPGWQKGQKRMLRLLGFPQKASSTKERKKRKTYPVVKKRVSCHKKRKKRAA